MAVTRSKVVERAMREDLAQAIADAESSINIGVLLAASLGFEDVRQALLTARSVLRDGLGEARE